MSQQPRVFVLGDLNVDVILPIDEYPAPGGDKRSEEMVVEAGGSAANTAIVINSLGRPSSLIACTGTGEWAEIARARVSASGVDLQSVQRAAAEPTGLMFIPVTPDGQRTLFGRRGANRSLQASELPIEQLRRSHALHLSGYALLQEPQRTAALAALEAAQDAGALTSLDTAFEPPQVAPEALQSVLSRLNLLILGKDEAAALSGRTNRAAVEWLLAQGPEMVALKLGADGAEIYQQDEVWKVPSIAVDTVDTTGAGDAFSAGLVHAQLSGLSPAAAGLLAAACGAAATTVWGAGAAFPGRSAVHEILQSGRAAIEGELREAWDQAQKKLAQPA